MNRMRVVIWLLLAALALLDAGAQICTAAVAVLFGIAFAVSLPFQASAWLLLAISRRITHGAPPPPPSPHGTAAP